MADIRIKDLATTATTTASDDFMAVDGVTNGTRKLSAATPAFLTSVTAPSLTSPALTNLTLSTGTSGAAVTVLSASNYVGIGTTSPSNPLAIVGSGATPTLRLSGNRGVSYAGSIVLDDTSGNTNSRNWLIANASYNFGQLNFLYSSVAGGSPDTQFVSMNAITGNVGIGTTSPSTKLEVAGVIKTTDTTPSSSSITGALQVAGGIYAGAASVFGSDLWANYAATGAIKLTQANNRGGIIAYSNAGTTIAWKALMTGGGVDLAFGTNVAANLLFHTDSTTRLTIAHTTGAATFTGAVTIGGNVGFYNNTPVAKPTGVAVTAAAIHAALVTLNLIAA